MVLGRRQWVWLAGWLVVVAAAVMGPSGASVQAAGAVVEQASSAASLVVRGKVVRQESFWSADGSQIESRSILAVRYTLAGAPATDRAGQIAVRTVGGRLPNGLAMTASHLPTLTSGEEVILLLQRTPTAGAETYEIADYAHGKFVVRNGYILPGAADHTDTDATALSLADFYRGLQGTSLATALPADWMAREGVPVAAESAGSAAAGGREYVANGYKWPLAAMTYKVNVNSTHVDGAAAGSGTGGNGTGDDFLAAVRRAANTWTYLEEATVALDYGGATASTSVGFNGANEIVFVDEGLTGSDGSSQPLATTLVFYMNDTIVEADVKINDAYAWDVTGSPTAAEFDLQSVVLHELGHLLGLGHDADDQAVMYGSLAGGAIKRALSDNDRRGAAAVYPCAAGSVCNPATPADPPFAPDPQVTQPPADAPPTPTPTPTPDPGATPEPTPLPTGPSASNAGVYLPLVQGGS